MRSSGKAVVGISIGALFSLASAVLLAADTAPSTAPPVKAVWQHHTAGFNYYGITTLYTCDGLETNMRALLLHLGARKDAKVTARGCPGGFDAPSRNAILETDFYALAPANDAHDTVPATWMPVEVSPTHPYFMGRGDCELIDEMKDLILKNFSLRNVSYRADCTPHEVNIDDFTVKAEALKPLEAGSKK